MTNLIFRVFVYFFDTTTFWYPILTIIILWWQKMGTPPIFFTVKHKFILDYWKLIYMKRDILYLWEKIMPKFVHTKFFPTRMCSYKITSRENLFPSSNIDNCLKININLLSLQEKVTKKPFLVLLVLILWRDIWKIHTPTHKLVPNTNLIFSVTRKKIDTTTRLWVPYFSIDPPLWHGN